MASRATHELAGVAAATVVAASLNQDIRTLVAELAIAVPIGRFAGRLPDLIEPSLNNPNHRQFFHSLVFASGVGVAMRSVYKWKPLSQEGKGLRWALMLLGAGYLSHLVLDFRTPRSLPII